eukprot:674318-Pleurochrysis_carterae.AAC.2
MSDAAQHEEEENAHMGTSATSTGASEGTIAERLLQRKRPTAAVVAPDLCQCATAPFMIYLCS